MESHERELTFHISVSNPSSRLSTPGRLAGQGETPRGVRSAMETEGSYSSRRLCLNARVSLLLNHWCPESLCGNAGQTNWHSKLPSNPRSNAHTLSCHWVYSHNGKKRALIV